MTMSPRVDVKVLWVDSLRLYRDRSSAICGGLHVVTCFSGFALLFYRSLGYCYFADSLRLIYTLASIVYFHMHSKPSGSSDASKTSGGAVNLR